MVAVMWLLCVAGSLRAKSGDAVSQVRRRVVGTFL